MEMQEMIQVKNSLNKTLMNTIKIIVIVSLILLFGSCNKKNATEKNLSQIKDVKVEDFDAFINKFYSDSLFQINRIVFPLESDKKYKKEYEEALGESKEMKNENSNYFPHNKENWLYLKQKYFKGKDTICSIGGVKYKRIINTTSQFVEEKILLSESEQVMIIIKFRIFHNKWFLIDYLDEFQNEW
jgi:hypothetical protein